MPNTSNAKKALRQNRTRRTRNRVERSTLRTLIKKFQSVAGGDDRNAAETAFRSVVKRLDQAAAKRLIHPNKAARTKSQLSKLLKPVTAADE